MVDLNIIRKRKARKIVAIVALVSTACLVVLGAVALLGQRAAPLTILLNNSGASLALAESSEEEAPKASFLLAKDTPGYTEYDGRALEHISDTEEIDSELSTTLLTPDRNSTLYYKYTFYVCNTGSAVADYKLSLDISYPNRNVRDFDLADILRVRFYENKDLSKHEYKTYANATSTYDAESGTYVKSPSHITTSDSDFAEMFESNKVILTSEVSALAPNEKIRYTFLFWLEGNDPDSEGKEAPIGSSLALGVNISAHESNQTDETTTEAQEE